MRSLAVLLLSVLPAISFAEQISIDEVAEHVSKQNYLVQENAVRVYQAKLSIAQARSALLPSLNIWTVLKVAIDPASIVDVAQDLVPFLVPGNWFRLKENKILYDVQKESYRALWSNEVFTARATFARISVDRDLLSIVTSQLSELQSLLKAARAQEALGVHPKGFSRGIEIKVIALEDDERRLRNLLREETSELLYQLGIPAGEDAELASIGIPDWSDIGIINPGEYEQKAIEASPELKSYDALLKVIPLIKKEIYFSVLGVSSTSRGVAGGVFDHIPITPGLGFGTGNSVKIVKKEEEVLRKQRQGALETLKRQLNVVALNHNSTVRSAQNIRRSVRLAELRVQSLRDRRKLGEPLDFNEYQESLESVVLARSKMLSVTGDYSRQDEQFRRLILSGDYKKGPIIEE